jgi:NADH dehydrogenase
MRIVIVGAGAAGLELACRLGRRRQHAITVVDRSSTHLWKPLLHQVAAGTLNSSQDQLSYLYLGKRNGFGYEPGDLQQIDPDAGEIELAPLYGPDGEMTVPQRRLGYDRAVICIGGEVNDFGVPGVRRHCHFLDSRPQAEAFHLEFLHELVRATLELDDQPHAINIIGGGATGVELAAELRHAQDIAAEYGGRAGPGRMRIRILEMAPRLLPPLPEELGHAARESLERLGVEVRCEASVTEVTHDEVVLAGGIRLPSQLTVWAAGIRGPEILARQAALEVSKRNQIRVGNDLRTSADPRLYAIGDCAECHATNDGSPVPARAQAARQQAIYLADYLTLPTQETPAENFLYRDYGSLISLSRYTAYGRIISGRRRAIDIDGWAAQIAYSSLYRSHQRTLLGLPATLTEVIIDRLRRNVSPALKMH